jgi:hypothetical protein
MKDVLEPDIAEIREETTRRSVQAVAALAAQDYESGGDMPHEVELEGVAVQVVGAAVSLASWWNDHPELPRSMMVNLAMEVLWVGLERARSGERI